MEAISASPGLNIVFAGTSPFAVPSLEALLDNNFHVKAVITQPDRPKGRGQTLQPPPVKTAALPRRVPIYQPLSLKNEEAHRLFGELAADLLVVVAYGKILPPWLLALPRHGAVNLHGSLLPRYRGAAPIQWAMANGETETGVCLMKLDEGLDTGPVFGCSVTAIDPEESVDALSSRLARLGADLLMRSIPEIVRGSLQPRPQDHALATLAPLLKKEDGVIDWSRSAQNIHNRARAFQPWPGARTEFRGLPLRILCTRVCTEKSSEERVGSLALSIDGRRSIAVGCGDGTLLELLEVQLPNRKPQSGIDFVNGMRVMPGEILRRPGESVSDNV